MNPTIEQIRRIDAQIKALSNILRKGLHIGAGLTVSVTVGPLHDGDSPDIDDIQMGVSGEPQALLELLVMSLTQSRAFWVTSLKRELVELQDAVTTLGDTP